MASHNICVLSRIVHGLDILFTRSLVLVAWLPVALSVLDTYILVMLNLNRRNLY